jgi:antibiotic biosynthesis monooxygenase (ABM) superfamily enzyme
MLLLWIAAYLILMALFTLFGEPLNGMPLALRVLIVSAVLVVVMSQLVIPIVARIVARYLARAHKDPV